MNSFLIKYFTENILQETKVEKHFLNNIFRNQTHKIWMISIKKIFYVKQMLN